MSIAIRNTLLLVLSGTAGYFDAVCYLGLFAVWLIYAGGAAIAVTLPREQLAALVFPAALVVMVAVMSLVAASRRWRRNGESSDAA